MKERNLLFLRDFSEILVSPSYDHVISGSNTPRALVQFVGHIESNAVEGQPRVHASGTRFREEIF